jgi:hypothetical protein
MYWWIQGSCATGSKGIEALLAVHVDHQHPSVASAHARAPALTSGLTFCWRYKPGDTNKEPSSAVHFSLSTMERNIANIYVKIGVREKADFNRFRNRTFPLHFVIAS